MVDDPGGLRHTAPEFFSRDSFLQGFSNQVFCHLTCPPMSPFQRWLARAEIACLSEGPTARSQIYHLWTERGGLIHLKIECREIREEGNKISPLRGENRMLGSGRRVSNTGFHVVHRYEARPTPHLPRQQRPLFPAAERDAPVRRRPFLRGARGRGGRPPRLRGPH